MGRGRTGVLIASLVALAATPALAQQPPVPPDSGGRVASLLPVMAIDSTGPKSHLTLADVLYLPVLGGFRVPSYDRSDGLALPWGPRLALPDDRVLVDALVTYRSELGRFDPELSGTAELTPRLRLRLDASRATLTNDTWSAPEPFNSAAVLIAGADGRNYFRADRVEGAAEWHSDRADESRRVGFWLGGRDEFDRSVGPDTAPAHVVWTLFDRRDREGNIRPDPSVERGHIASVLGGAHAEWTVPGILAATARVAAEVPWSTPAGERFAQLTADGRLTAATWADQFVSFAVHAVVTAGDTAPAQRFSYLGGLNTLPTLPMLARGGDELVFLESLYLVPIYQLTLPYVGAPAVGLHYSVGGAAVHRWPDLTQNVGIRLQLFLLGVDLMVDPATHRRSLTVAGAIPSTF